MRLTKLALTIAALTAASGVAMGQNIDPNTGPTDLFAVFTDIDNSQSIVQDLGAGTAGTFAYGTPQNFTIDANLATLLNDLSTTAADVTFQVIAASNVNPTQALDFTSTTGNSVLADAGSGFFNNTDVINATTALGTFLGANASHFAIVNGYNQLTGNAANPSRQIYGASGVTLGYFQTPSAPGDTVDFFTSLTDGNPIHNTTTAQKAGEWGYNNVSDVLSWTPTAVPLPPAVWMLLSGLLGVGAIGRRRGTAAV